MNGTRGRWWAGVLAAVLLGAGAAHAGPIRHREHHQRARIASGAADGSLTRGEARVLRAEQRAIEHMRRDALRDDGRIGPAERRRITRAQNRASAHITALRHNERTRGR